MHLVCHFEYLVSLVPYRTKTCLDKELFMSFIANMSELCILCTVTEQHLMFVSLQDFRHLINLLF